MPYSRFDKATESLLDRAFENAWFKLPNHLRWSPLHQANTLSAMTKQLFAAADAGERDLDLLVKATLEGIDRS